MPPQSDLERLTEIKNSIADRGTVSQADADRINAMREKLTGERPDNSELASVADAANAISELEEIVRDRDAENVVKGTSDDGKGSVELGTDAVHRGADQTADDKPTPNAPVDPAAAKEDLAAREEGTQAIDGSGDANNADGDEDGDAADHANETDDEADVDADEADAEGDEEGDAEADTDEADSDANEVKTPKVKTTKAKTGKAKAAKTGKKK